MVRVGNSKKQPGLIALSLANFATTVAGTLVGRGIETELWPTQAPAAHQVMFECFGFPTSIVVQVNAAPSEPVSGPTGNPPLPPAAMRRQDTTREVIDANLAHHRGQRSPALAATVALGVDRRASRWRRE